jgi:hypothetical protein
MIVLVSTFPSIGLNGGVQRYGSLQDGVIDVMGDGMRLLHYTATTYT